MLLRVPPRAERSNLLRGFARCGSFNRIVKNFTQKEDPGKAGHAAANADPGKMSALVLIVAAGNVANLLFHRFRYR